MKKLSVLIAAGMLAMSTAAFAADSGTAGQTAAIEIDPISVISFSSPTITLDIHAAEAGLAPTDATDTSTTYSITSNAISTATKVITAKIDTAMPTGVTLKVNLTAPTLNGASPGDVTLTGTAQPVVTGIFGENEASLAVSYTLSAVSTAAQIASGGLSKTVTYTIADAS